MKKKRRKRPAGRKPVRGRGRGKKAAVFLVLFLLAGSLAAGAWMLVVVIRPFFSMPAVALENVRIDGAGPLDSMEILRKAGIGRDTDIMEINLPGLKNRLLKAEPRIENARIVRNPAAGSLSISLTLRRPAALVNADGVLLAVDSQGTVLGGMEQIDFEDLPVITGLGISPPSRGGRIAGDRIATALEIIGHSAASGLDSRAHVSEVNISDPRHIVIYAGADGMQIRLGPDDIEAKINEAAAIAAYLEQREEKAEYIDLRFRKTMVKPADAGR